jgi:TolB-like protein
MRKRSHLREFGSELKRRKVFRVAAVYAATAFVIAQAADIFFPGLGLPEWSLPFVLALLLLGFPLAVALAWIFDLTPGGVVRTDAPSSADPVSETAPGPVPAQARTRGRLSPERIAAVGGMVVLALAGGAFILFDGSGDDAEDVELDRSIAVLPFANLSAEQENAFFASGIHEEILTQLSKIGDLRVISRTSVLQFEPGQRNLREIAGELGVAAVVEGSVQRDGDRVRISAQLIDARSDRHLWGDRYDRDLTDIFAIQSEVALEIAHALRANLTAGEEARIARRPTENLAAYDLYLRGQQLVAQDREQNETAVELFRQAIRLDPDFALAHAGLASAFMQRVQTYGFPHEWADSGVVAARRSIELDPELAPGYSALASNLSQLGRLGESQVAARRSVELDPNRSSGLIGISINAALLGRIDKAMDAARRARLVEPTSPYPPAHLAWHHWSFGQDDEAEQWLRRSLEVQAGFDWAEAMWVILDVARGRAPEALARARQRVQDSPRDFVALMSAGNAALLAREYEAAAEYYDVVVRMYPEGRHVPHQYSFRTSLGFALLKTGQRERAAGLFQQALAQAHLEMDQGRDSPGIPFDVAMIHIVRGEPDAGYEWLERAYAAGWRHDRFTRLLPMLEGVADDARFQDLLARMEADIADQRARSEREL